MILATDLDGTFLGGDPDNRQRLYQLIDAHPDIRLVFVTGRGLEVVPLLSDPVIARPDYVICDVGVVTLEVRQAVEALGCALLYSADMYLDCLPAGVGPNGKRGCGRCSGWCSTTISSAGATSFCRR